MSEEIVHYEDVVGSNHSVRNIILAGWPSERVVAVEQLLRRVVPQTSAVTERDPARLNPFSERLSLLRNSSDADLVRREIGRNDQDVLFIFVEELGSVLAREFSKGSAADLEVVRDWEVATDRLLALTNTDNPRIKIVSINDVFAAPSMFVEYLSGVLAWPLCFSSSPEVTANGKWDDFYLMVANQYIHDNGDVYRLEKELASRRDFVPVPFTGTSSRVDWSAVMQDVEAVRYENSALLEMLHKVQLEFEETMVGLGKAEEKVQQLLSDNTAKERTLKEATEQLQKLSKDNAAKKQALREAKEQASDGRNAVKKLKATESARKRAEGSVEAVHASTSWKVTAPLRGVVTWLRR